MDSDLPVSDVLTMNQLLVKHTFDQSFNATLLTAFATLSLLLAAVGLFGVMSYIAGQRTTEIGIRIALGAKREHVMRKMLMDGMRPAVLGLVVGLAASLAVRRLMRDLLYEIKPLDPMVLPQWPRCCSRWPRSHVLFPRGVHRASIRCKH